MTPDPKDMVRRGYDAVSYAYRGDTQDESWESYLGWLDELSQLLQDGAYVLDLGCGCGLPVSQILAQNYKVTGIDISPVQIERARANVPDAEFICADITAIDFPKEGFDAIVAFYSIIHIPLEEQPNLLTKLHNWLKPNGYLMATVGHRAWTGEEQDWLGAGASMYWSHADKETYLDWLSEAGFDVLWTRFIPEGKGGHTLLLAKKPSEVQ